MKRNLWKIVALVLVVCSLVVGMVACGDTDPEITESYSVTFTGGTGATGTAPTIGVQKTGAVITLPQNTFAKEGYTFKNWSDGAKTYAAGASYTINQKNVTFTAVWEANPCTITWALGDKAAADATAPATTNTTYGATVTLPAAPAALEGYEFAGWMVPGEDEPRAAESSYVVVGTTTITATWKVIPPAPVPTYTVTYVPGTNAADATTAPAPETDKAAGTVITLPAAPAAAKGFVFVGWLVEGETDVRAAGSEYTVNANAVITAQWRVVTYTVTYNLGIHAAEGATAPDAETDKEAGAVITLPAAPAAATGYLFAGWQVNGEATQREAGSEYTVAGDVTITAIWNVSSYTITFMDGETELATAETNAEGWIKKDNRPADPTKEHFVFKHWSLTENGEAIDLGVKYFNGNTTVYAVWEAAPQYTITYNAGNWKAEGEAPADEQLYAGDTYTFPTNAWTLAHQTFAGYVVQAESAPGADDWSNIIDTVYQAGDTYTMPAGNIRIKGTWTAATVTVTLDANGGTGEMTGGTFVYGNSYTIPACTFTAPEGKEFAYWAFSDGTEIELNPVGSSKYGSHVTATETLTIMAVWKDKEVVVTYTFSDMVGLWTNGNDTVLVSTVGAGDGLDGSVIVNGTQQIMVYTYEGVLCGYDYKMANAFVMTFDGTTLTITKDDGAFFSATEKSTIINADRAAFEGKWMDAKNRILYVTADKAYRTTALATASIAVVGDYAVISYAYDEYTTYTYLLKVTGDTLTGVFFGDNEKDPETVTFTKGGFYALSVNGVLNQLVRANQAPTASKVTAPVAPAGEKFDKWVLVGTETAFDLTANMTADADIEAKFVTDVTPPPAAGDVYTGSYTFALTSKTVVKITVNDLAGKDVTIELSDGTVVALTDFKNSPVFWVAGNEKEIDVYYYAYASVMGSREIYLAFAADRSTIYVCNSDDEVTATFTIQA